MTISIRGEQETLEVATFGRRKVAPRVNVFAHKPHVRTFLCESFEELGMVAHGCAPEALEEVSETAGADLAVVGVSTDGDAPAEVLARLARSRFQGRVLLIGNPDLPSVSAAQLDGAQLGLSMLPVLGTPYRQDDLREHLAGLLPGEPAPPIPIDVAEALHAGWLELWYQPKYDARSLSLSGAEALIRMRHPTWGIVLPAYFIPDEGDPHFRALSDFVVTRAMEDWHYFVESYAPIDLAINLPMAVLQDAGATDELRRRLPQHAAFRGLTVEVDSTAIVRDPAAAGRIARRLRFDNVGIAIDDVGAEWPQLMAFEDFPFVEIKVDRQFVTGCADDRLKQSVCRRIVEFADTVGARTVAEGVETRAEFVTASEIGFDEVQGFLFAKPMGARKFARTILRQPMILAQ